MLGSIVNGMGIVFPSGRTMRFVKNAINITIYANLVILTKNITVTALNCCTPPLARLAGHCVAVIRLLGAVPEAHKVLSQLDL